MYAPAKDANLLIVEDNADYRDLINRSIDPGHQRHFAETLGQARHALDEKEFDLVILDIILPDGSGFDFLVELRKNGNPLKTPVIILSSINEAPSKVKGLSLGAQDYLTKPFEPTELAARVNSLIKIAEWAESTDEISGGNLNLDVRNLGAVLILENATRSVDLSSLEFRLMRLLIENKDSVLKRDLILDTVWGKDRNVTGRTVDTTIAALRKKLTGWDHQIRSVYKVGYKLVPIN